MGESDYEELDGVCCYGGDVSYFYSYSRGFLLIILCRMIVVAGIAMTIPHPGCCFPQPAGKMLPYDEALGNELVMEDANNTKVSSKSASLITGV